MISPRGATGNSDPWASRRHRIRAQTRPLLLPPATGNATIPYEFRLDGPVADPAIPTRPMRHAHNTVAVFEHLAHPIYYILKSELTLTAVFL